MFIGWVMPSSHVILCHALLLLPSIFPSIRIFSSELTLGIWSHQLSSVQSFSHVQLFVTPWTVAHQAFLSITNSWSLLKLMSIQSVMPSNHAILSHTFILLSSIFPKIKVISNESALHTKWPKYWSFSFSINSPIEYSGLISFYFLFIFFNEFLFFIIIIFYFTLLYWFCHTSTCICHGCTCVPHPEPPSHLHT